MKVIVGSKNPVKIKAVEEEFLLHFPPLVIQGKEVLSNVRAQPSTLEETCEGAINRAKNAFDLSCTLSVGLESGIYFIRPVETQYLNTCFCAIYNGKNIIGLGTSSGFELPPRVIDKLMQNGRETGDTLSELTGVKKIGYKEGVIIVLSQGKIDRKKYTREAIRNALFRILNRGLYSI